MSESQGVTSTLSMPEKQGIHFNTIKNSIPACYIQASPDRRKVLKQTKPKIPDWYANASEEQKKRFKENSETLCHSQNNLDKQFAKLKSIDAFAKDLLVPELKKLDRHLDPDTTWLRLYAPKSVGIFGLKSGFQVKTLSLLNAALHNFEEQETSENFYDASSGFITQPDLNGHFERFSTSVKIETFTRLCRTLDIGGQYEKYIKAFLRPDNSVAQAVLRQKITAHQKDALRVAANLALLKKDIDQSDYNLLMKVVDGEQKIMQGDKQLYYRSLSIMGLHLSACVLFMPCVKRRYHEGYLIAYIPDDPEHPLKKYASFSDFQKELTRQLTTDGSQDKPLVKLHDEPTDYQRFFSRFVAQRDKPYYFKRFTEKVTDAPEESFATQWRRHELVKLGEKLVGVNIPQVPDVGTRRDPIADLNLYIIDNNLPGKALWEDFDLWAALHDAKLDRLINDARIIAVPTADEDAKTRSDRWANYLNIAFISLGAFAFVVPGLGEALAVVMVGQVLYEVLEGVVEWGEGDKETAWAHFTDVIENLATTAALAPVFHYTVSPFIENLKTITSFSGKTKLWKADLKPYEYKGTLPQNLAPNESGIYQHQGKTILGFEKKLYEVKDNAHTGERTIEHPTRADAYNPLLKHNGAGAYVLEGEQPRTWDDAKLMRRLGHSVEAFSDLELEQIRRISGTDHSALRRMYLDNTPPPPLLADSLKRLKTYRHTQQQIEHIRTGLPLDPSSYWFEPLPTYLEGWPSGKALKVYENADLSGSFRHYGNAEATVEQTLATSLSHVMSGQLPQSLIGFLSEEELQALLGPQTARDERLQTLRNRLADEAGHLEVDIFNQRYQAGEHTDTPHIRQLRTAYPDLSATTAQQLLNRASAAELERMTQEQRLPLRLKNLARDAAFETRTSHAYEGFYHDTHLTTDSERLALNALRIHTDTFSDLRIEVREGSYAGPLRCRVGAEDASVVRVLVRNAQAKYEVHGEGKPPREADDFFEAVLHALPDAKRSALGYRLGEGQQFKQWIMAKTAAPSERRTVLAEPPIRPVPDLETVTLLRGPTMSRAGTTVEEKVQDLYPHLNERELNTFVQSLGPQDQALETLERLERDLDNLKVTLNKWRYQQPDSWGPDRQGFLNGGGQHIADRLIECFERKATVFGERSATLEGGYALDLSNEFNLIDLELWWKKRPDLKYYLDQISTLNLDNTRFSAGADGVLKDFPQLRQLSARRCQLTQLPEGIGKMHFLQTLRLIDNQIRLTPSDVEQLRNLTYMETIRLDDNPRLGNLPNVERMPKLKILSLSNTGATTWPEGVFKKSHPRGFYLDLMENPLTTVPDVVPGSDEARIVARTRLQANNLSDANRIAYKNYRQSVGLSPTHYYSAAAERAIDQWPMSDDTHWWSNNAVGLGVFREEAWHDLMNEPNSDGFFRLIQKQTLSADYRAGGESRQQLSARVWRMIEVMDLDSKLCNELFEMASAPTTCADAGAQVFNHMGIKVLVSEAYAQSTSAQVLESKLVALAKGAARLQRVDDIARADFGSRTGNPDEVEVYLAYETGLARRLDLPWQSERMAFRPVAGVSDETINTAFDTVVDMEQGDGLVNAMIEQPFWERYLRDTYPREVARNTRLFEHKTELLDELRDAQHAWADSRGLQAVQRQMFKQRLQELAGQLAVQDSALLTDERMSDEVYDAMLKDIGYEEKQLSRTLTRTALQNVGQ